MGPAPLLSNRCPVQSNRSSTHILLVDDDAEIALLAERYFRAQGVHISTATNGPAMRHALTSGVVDLVLLDLGLPGEDGFDLLRWLRGNWHGPVIILSGRGETVDRVVGLEMGADDYVTKPFDLRELLARVRTVLRRSGSRPLAGEWNDGTVRFAGHRLDRAARLLTDAGGREIHLTTGEFELLCALLERPCKVLSRDDLLSLLHGRAAGPYDRSIDMQIGRLRRKIEADPASPEIIKSVRGAGYLFAARPEWG